MLQSQTLDNKSVLVLGAGNFGTCLAHHLATKGHNVKLWSVEEDIVRSINEQRRNPRYLSSAILSERIVATNKISKEMVEQVDAVVIAIPTQAIRQVLSALKHEIGKGVLIVCAAKGMEIKTHRLPLEIIADTLGASVGENACILSGPSFASEVIEGQPTAVSIASINAERAFAAQELFHTPFFRVYTSDDPVGLEVSGAVKNIIAIASGAVTGLGFENNARVALITRGLAEITRIGAALGANPLTFTGLGGVGDLFLTCTSEKSRNFSVGFSLAQGTGVDETLSSMKSVAEGVFTAKAIYEMTRPLKIETPICSQVYQVLYEAKPIKEAVNALLNRDPKPEIS